MVIGSWIATQVLAATVAAAAGSLPTASEAAATPVAAGRASDAVARPAPVDYTRRGIGFTAGGTSGVGFAWRDVNREGLGYSVGGGLWIDSFTQVSARWAFGLQGIKVLHQTDWWRLYVLAGVQSYGYPTYIQPTPIAPPAAPPVPTSGTPTVEQPVYEPPKPVLESIINVGGGLGLELGGPPGVTLALELPIVIGYRIGPQPGLHHLLPFPNLMLIYNF